MCMSLLSIYMHTTSFSPVLHACSSLSSPSLRHCMAYEKEEHRRRLKLVELEPKQFVLPSSGFIGPTPKRKDQGRARWQRIEK